MAGTAISRFACDGHRLVVLLPHPLTRRHATADERSHWITLRKALAMLTDLRAGSAGRLALSLDLPDQADRLLAPARVWRSVTGYAPIRHGKRMSAHEAVAADIDAELRALGLPTAHVRVLSVRSRTGGGLVAEAELTFAVAVQGPILIGRTRHKGGGLFAGVA
jgi:CRISPR-associated protein Csb2